MREKKPISDERREQLRRAGQARAKSFTPEYQRQAGQALKEKVDPVYYRVIGRLGGRRTMFNTLLKIAANWQFSQEQIATSKVSERRRDELVAGMRQHYREEAEKYLAPWGNKVFLEFYEPGSSGMQFKRKRVRTPKSCRKAATALRAGNSPNNETGKRSRKRKTGTEKT